MFFPKMQSPLAIGAGLGDTVTDQQADDLISSIISGGIVNPDLPEVTVTATRNWWPLYILAGAVLFLMFMPATQRPKRRRKR